MINKSWYTSNKQDWETPQILFNKLDSVFNFNLDAAANDKNHKVENYFTEKDNALTIDWTNYEKIFINPPYITQLQNSFIAKSYSEWKKHGTTVCLLVPARVETKRWSKYIFPYEIGG